MNNTFFYILLSILLFGTYKYIGYKVKHLINFLILLISYFIYTFYNLGSNKIPQSYEVYNYSGTKTSIQFENVSKIDELCYYFGINKNSKFSFSYQKKDKWEKFYSSSGNFPLSFQWLCKDVNISTKNIEFTLLEGQAMLNELRFRYQNKDINFTSTQSFLNDESNIAVNKNYYQNMIFDEIYHSRTAYEIISYL